MKFNHGHKIDLLLRAENLASLNKKVDRETSVTDLEILTDTQI